MAATPGFSCCVLPSDLKGADSRAVQMILAPHSQAGPQSRCNLCSRSQLLCSGELGRRLRAYEPRIPPASALRKCDVAIAVKFEVSAVAVTVALRTRPAPPLCFLPVGGRGTASSSGSPRPDTAAVVR